MSSLQTKAEKPKLKLDWCSHEAAKYAVEHWHYSKRMPVGPMVKVGVWENEKFIGCVLFARGANNALGCAYNLSLTEVCELVRIALTIHETPVSRIIAIAQRFLIHHCPGLRLVVSYADSEQGHHGGVYQASNWVYVGRSSGSREFFHEGRWKHNREVTAGAFGGKPKHSGKGKGLPCRLTQGKHKYLMPLDDAMRGQIAPLAKPYPKKQTPEQEIREHATRGDSFPKEDGGAKPTCSLHLDNHGTTNKI